MKSKTLKKIRISIYLLSTFVGLFVGLFESKNDFTAMAYPNLYILYFFALFVLGVLGLFLEIYCHRE